MANKLFLVSATLALFFLLTNASIYRTIVEFDENDDTDRIRPMGPKQKLCQKDFKEAEHLRACQRWIRKQTSQRRRPSLDDDDDNDDEFDFEDDMENRRPGQQQRPQLLQKCCQELHEESPVCVCPTLKEAAQAVRLQGQHRPIQVRRIFQTAKHLPNVCNVTQVGVCPFQATPSRPSYY